MKTFPLFLLVLSLTFVLLSSTASAQTSDLAQINSINTTAVGTAFNFQGVLRTEAGAVNGQCDFKFALFASLSGNNAIGSALFRSNLSLSNGQFATSLDFGNVFTGEQRWIETSVRCPAGSGTYVLLSPRQEIGIAPYALYAQRVAVIDSAAGDFTAKGILKSSRGVPSDLAAGSLQLENTLTGNKWQLNTHRDSDILLLGFIDKNNLWSHVASFDRNGGLMLAGDLYLNKKVTSDVFTTGALHSARGRADDPNGGLIILDNTTTNNRWHIATMRDSDNLEFWFGENAKTWNHAATIEHNGSVHVFGDSLIMVDTSRPAGLLWGTTDAAVGRANGAGEWSRDAKAGDLVIRPDDGSRLLLTNGTKSSNYAAALTIEASGVVSISNLQSGGYIEANLQTASELAANRIDRFSQGDVLCWQELNERLEKCAAQASPLVAAVADANGKPLILGVEMVKILGPVQAGDLLVASTSPGYAIAWSQVSKENPPPGIVIAKALQSTANPTFLIKAMILAR